jgi:hypothetical protein
MTPGSPKWRSWTRRALPVALATAGLAVAGCGDSGSGPLLSSRQAGDLRAKLTEIEQDVSSGNCTGAAEQVSALEQQIDSMRRLDRNLRSALRASARRLDTLVSADCGAGTETTPTETTTTPQEGTTGTTGTTGATGEQGKKPKKPKKEKKVPPGQDGTPSGQDENPPSGGGDGAGGGGSSGESNPSGGSTP